MSGEIKKEDMSLYGKFISWGKNILNKIKENKIVIMLIGLFLAISIVLKYGKISVVNSFL